MRAIAGLILLVAAEAAAGEGGAKDVGADAAGGGTGAGAGATAAALAALVPATPPCEAARAHCVGIKLHVAVVDGAPVASPDWVAAQVAAANRHFAAIDVGLQVLAAAALPAAAARIADARARTQLASLVAGTAIDVFVTAQLDDIDKPGGVIRGVAWPAGAKKFVIVSTIAPERVLAHELGHVFGLPHSGYAVSIMNKAERKEPPVEQRTFHERELSVMRGQLARMLREKVIADVPATKSPSAPSAPATTPAEPATTPAASACARE